MPPAAKFDISGALEVPCDSIVDVGSIEVEALTSVDKTSVVTRISLLPRDYSNEVTKRENEMKSSAVHPGFPYLQGGTERCLADSFDDEIEEDSNEAKLIKSIAERATVLSYSLDGGIGHQPRSNDGYVLDETEAQYLDVLDHHLETTEPESVSFTSLNDDPDDPHPNKGKGNMDQIMEHLLDNACCECSSGLQRPLKSSLRHPRWTHTSSSSSVVGFDTTSRSRSVGFKDVDIREFRMTLGNHPSATSGPPVMLDWNAKSDENVVDLETYERGRRPRRNRRQLKLSLQQRHNILVKEQGFAFEEVKQAWQEALEIRKQRKETLERGLALMKWDEIWESSCRKFNRLVDGVP